MIMARVNIWLIIFILFTCIKLHGQEDNLLQRPISLKFAENSLLGHVDNLLLQENIVVAFNSSRVDLKEIIRLPVGEESLEDIIRLLFYSHNISLTTTEDKVIVIFLDSPAAKSLTIKGYIRDKDTGEALVGASVVELSSNSSTFSNESGFYSLTIPVEPNSIAIHYLGYKSLLITNVAESSLNLSLEFDNEIDQIVIEGSVSDNFLLGSGSEKIDMTQTIGFQNISGDNDVIKAVRISPKVQSGNEGQVGLYVRGGSSNQNLILFDGIPLYEVSHTAGFSSIFIEESIKDIDFITNGFPARYGGRLSSVMNVRLKEGNQNDYNGSVKLSLPALKAHLEGPLFSEKTTFNISGRVSYIDKYLNQLVGDIVSFNNIDLNYSDFIGKITHRFSPTQKLSFSYYTGEDNIGLDRYNRTDNDTLSNTYFETNSNNSLSWGSTVWNFKFTNVVSDKLQMTANFGGINYKNESRARYAVNSVIDSLPSPRELDILTRSQIDDRMASFNFDYYMNDHHRFKFGGSWIHHRYEPALYGNDTIIIDNETLVRTEEFVQLADELAVYVEDTYRPHKNWEIYGGLHISSFRAEDQTYSNIQPRFSTVFTPNLSNRFTVSYSNMFQYVHLLVNPGIGLPSDFWVPTTDEFKPEFARQLSVDYSRKINNSIELSVSAYTKSIENVLEYEGVVDLFFDFENQINYPTAVTEPDWQEFVLSGSSRSRGVEIQIRKTSGKVTGWASYALSKTTRLFEGINNFEEFPYKYDRRHDINLGVKYDLNKKCSFSLNWVYGSGNSFSIGNERIVTPILDANGDPVYVIVSSGKRNNLRFPGFHHLDVQFNYNKKVKGGVFTFNLGLYNVYNRKNTYYIYVYYNSTEDNSTAYKTSIFPILPNMSIGYSF